MDDDCNMNNVLRTANFILWMMSPLPLGFAALSSVLRRRRALVPIQNNGGRASGGDW
jgi:hypothetical protein